MLILSLDTTTRAGSAAVLRGDVVLAEHSGDPSLTHGQRLPADLTRVLDEAAIRIEDIDLFAVAAGPGSFTGLRVGIATIQGLAMARGRKVVAVSALDALARSAINANDAIGAWIDAQRGEVFAALYAPDGRDILAPARSGTPLAVVQAWQARPDPATVVFVGDGAVRYRDEIAAAIGSETRIAAPPPLAGFIGQIAAADPSRAALPHAIVPIYIRKTDVELARDRKAAQ